MFDYNDIFAKNNEKLSTNNFYKQKLRMIDDIPVFTKSYRIPQSQKEQIREQVDNYIQNDIIEPSTFEFSSPIFLVPKKNEGNNKENGD